MTDCALQKEIVNIFRLVGISADAFGRPKLAFHSVISSSSSSTCAVWSAVHRHLKQNNEFLPSLGSTLLFVISMELSYQNYYLLWDKPIGTLRSRLKKSNAVILDARCIFRSQTMACSGGQWALKGGHTYATACTQVQTHNFRCWHMQHGALLSNLPRPCVMCVFWWANQLIGEKTSCQWNTLPQAHLILHMLGDRWWK